MYTGYPMIYGQHTKEAVAIEYARLFKALPAQLQTHVVRYV